MVTTTLRKDFNNMSKALNNAIQDAVARNAQNGAHFVDIELGTNGKTDMLATHRFCEKGVNEPDLNNVAAYFWHYPYTDTSDSNTNDPNFHTLAKAYNMTVGTMLADDINNKWPSETDLISAVYDQIQKPDARDDAQTTGPWDWVGYRARTFHPQTAYHAFIRDKILAQYKSDIASASSSQTGPDTQKCNSISGDFWVNSSNVAVQSAEDFCGQTDLWME
jgi:hypothetical protein